MNKIISFMKKYRNLIAVILTILIVILCILITYKVYNKSVNESNESINNTTERESTVEEKNDYNKCTYAFKCTPTLEDSTYSCNYLNEELEVEEITCDSYVENKVLYSNVTGSVFYFYTVLSVGTDESYIRTYSSTPTDTEYTIFSLVDSYTCKSNGCNVFNVVLDKYVVIYDGNYFIYDIVNKSIVMYLNIDKVKYSDIDLVIYDGEIIGLELVKVSNNKTSSAYYDLLNEKYIIDFGNYKYIDVSDELLKRNYIAGYNDYYDRYLIDINTGEVIKEISGYIAGDNIIYYYDADWGVPDDTFIYKLYDNDFNLVREFEDGVALGSNVLLEDDNLIIAYNNRFYIYDNNYDLVFTSLEYDVIYNVFKDYVAVNIDGYLSLVDYQGNLVCTMTQITGDMYVHTMISGWYTENGKNGIYMVVQDPNFDPSELSDSDYEYYQEYGSSEDFGYEYYYIPETGESGRIATLIGGYAKPVLYLYPEDDNTLVTVSFEKPYLLTTTYPKYETEWVITANKNGDLYDVSGRYYYALYWEEIGYNKVDFSTGFYVTKDNAIDFLEEKLSIIGLTEREANEFIMYWLPVLEENEQSLVYFELTEDRNSYNKLIIDPAPDSLLRVAIHIKKVSEYKEIEEQVLPTFERTGFVAVEWGGVRY